MTSYVTSLRCKRNSRWKNWVNTNCTASLRTISSKDCSMKAPCKKCGKPSKSRMTVIKFAKEHADFPELLESRKLNLSNTRILEKIDAIAKKIENQIASKLSELEQEQRKQDLTENAEPKKQGRNDPAKKKQHGRHCSKNSEIQ
eukprot:gb/GECG01007853.1/.p1 GENE.gb/GECG01007853.1/~~gb/GECG01007853.1/.p1  ORF type:complete len:144 (+),score=23.11 gb/GECG01007853.1/:1-432(+)